MKVEVREMNGKKFMLLPDEISSSQLEVFKLKDGFYLLTVPLEQQKKQPKAEEKLSEEEKRLLIDLSLIKFEKRTLANVKNTLSKKQLELLKSLIKRGYVSIFKKGKYKDIGVLNFTDQVFGMLKEEARRIKEKTEQVEKQGQFQSAKPFFTLSKNMQRDVAELVAKGYLAVIGMDNKIYVARAKDFSVLSNKIKEALKKEEKGVGEIARELGEDDEAVGVALKILWARGEVIEARKNVFMLVE
ncbi:MAG: hypothetical protein ACPL06_04660, partial [Candidatus Anstonellales archaeon]